MREFDEKLSTLFELIDTCVLGISDGIIVFANPAAATLLGNDAVGKKADCMLPGHIICQESDSFTACAEISGQNSTVTVSRFDGLLILSIVPTEKNPPRKLFAPAALISSLRSSAFTLKLATDQLINCVKDDNAEKLDSYISTLYQSYYRILRLTVNLDTANQLVAKNISFAPAVCDISKICSDLVSTVKHFTSDKEVNIKYSGGDKKLFAAADPDRLEQLVLNLLSNSLDNAKPGGNIEVRVREDGDNVIISVDDDGKGITNELMSGIFTKFDRDFTLSELGGGAGLGLGIAKGIAQLHGGALIVESRPGIKTSVRAMIPKNLPSAIGLRSPELKPPDATAILRELSGVVSSWVYNKKYFD